jgi:hypothetical protein
LEFLEDVDAFRQAISNISNVLEENGQFVFCVAHPTGHPKYPDEISNSTDQISSGAVSILLYSIRDLVQGVCDADMAVDRVIEQKTMNPSQISYEESLQFPYRFKKGRNPFHLLFDSINNKNPHTIIIRARKLV